MEARVSEIAAGIYRLSTHVAEIAPPAGFTFNQFLIAADQPLLFHCGHRRMFPLIGAELSPRTLALMHGSSFVGDCAGAQEDLAGHYERRVRAAPQ